MKMKVVDQMELPTNNRGIQTFIISQNEKGFYAHELGELTSWARAFGTGERKAHPLNPTRRYRYRGYRFRPQPFPSAQEAKTVIQERASTWALYG